MRTHLSTLAMCLLAASLAKTAVAQPWTPRTNLGDGWRTSPPEHQGVSTAQIQAMVDLVAQDPVFGHAFALVVVRHGTMIAEAYYNGRTPTQTSDVRSVTKSVLSMATGVALSQGDLSSVDDRLETLLPEYNARLSQPGKSQITLEDALTMRGGLRWDDTANPWLDALFSAPDLVDYTLAEPLLSTPGTTFQYSSGLSQVIGEVLEQATARRLSAYVQQKIFQPLGINDWGWLVRPSGRDFGGLGMRIRPRDMAKIGQMALQRGRFGTSRVVPDWWLNQSTQSHVPGSSYGYHWWVTSNRVIAIGYGGQYISIDENNDVLIVLQVNWNVFPTTSIGYTDFSRLDNLLTQGLQPEQPGSLVFSETSETTQSESSSSFEVTIERQGGSDGSAEIYYQTLDGTARSGSDYTRKTGVLVWNHGDNGPKTFQVPIRDDNAIEGAETLRVRLERSAGGVSMPAGDLTLTITDNDGATPGTFSVTAAQVMGSEGETVSVSVERSGGSVGAATIEYLLSPLSGEPGIDTTVVSGSLSWDDNEGGAQTIEIPLAIDGVVERTELVAIQLSSPDAEIVEGLATLVILDVDTPPGCVDSELALCLLEGRFRVEIEWLSQYNGEHGYGYPQAISDESGWAWFFNETNLELTFKVLDGTAYNDYYWVFYGGLSDVEYWVVVTDTWTGEVKLYRNTPGEVCGRGDVAAFEDPPAGLSAPSPEPGLAAPPLKGVCDDDPDALCLLEGRFRVSVRWATDTESGDGHAMDTTELIPGDETGLFWFFSAGNVELAVKVLDGTGINDHFWIFAGGLSSVDYWIDVTDTSTGEVRSYYKPNGSVCGVSDNQAFSALP